MCWEPGWLLVARSGRWGVRGSPVGGGRATDTSFCSGLGGSGGGRFSCLSSPASFYLYDKTHRRMPFLAWPRALSQAPPQARHLPCGPAYAGSASLWPWAGELCRRVSGSRALSPSLTHTTVQGTFAEWVMKGTAGRAGSRSGIKEPPSSGTPGPGPQRDPVSPAPPGERPKDISGSQAALPFGSA